MTIISAGGRRRRQYDLEFKASLSYIMRPHIKKQKLQKQNDKNKSKLDPMVRHLKPLLVGAPVCFLRLPLQCTINWVTLKNRNIFGD
jgi:hypothetical protein